MEARKDNQYTSWLFKKIRVVTIQTRSGIIKQPILELCFFKYRLKKLTIDSLIF